MRINDNNDRAARALRAVEAYKANDWRGRGPEDKQGDELLEALGDLIGDLHHLCDRVEGGEAVAEVDAITGRDGRWDAVIDKGDFHYREEVAEEGLEARGVTSWTMGEAGLKLATLVEQGQKCRTCGESYPDAGDGWDGECGNCADKTADPFANRGVLRAFLECLTDRIDPQHFPVEATWLEEWVLENGDRIEEEAFRGLDGIERDALESFEERRRDQAETRRENGE